MAIKLATFKSAAWGVPWVLRGRSNSKKHHSHACSTTCPRFLHCLPPAAPPPPPRSGVVIVHFFQDGVEALNDIRPGPIPNPSTFAGASIPSCSR